MMRKEIIGYQFAERIKSALIICSKMLQVLETLEGNELEGAKKVMLAFFDALSAENALALKATGMPEFERVEETIKPVKRMIEEHAFSEAHATLGSTVSRATTACDRTMRALMEEGLM
jgi:Fic family protein